MKTTANVVGPGQAMAAKRRRKKHESWPFWRAIGMPEAGHHHVLDGACFAIGEFYRDLFTAFALAGFFAAIETLLLGALTG